MKLRLIPVLMLVLWFFQGVVPALWYQHEAEVCYSDFESGKEKNEFQKTTTILFKNPGDIRWKKYHKEFIWNGTMYDVVSMRQTNSGVVVTCLADKKETHAEQAFQRVNGKQGKSNGTENNRMKFQLQKYMAEDAMFLKARPGDVNRVQTDFQSRVKNIFFDIASPPPKNYCS